MPGIINGRHTLCKAVALIMKSAEPSIIEAGYERKGNTALMSRH